MIRVLVADDAVAIRGIMRKILSEEAGFEVVGTSANGKLAVEDYKRLKPDIVTLDIEMPEMNGLEALEEILKLDPDARVIMCSSLTQSGAQSTLRALDLGAKDFIPKPTSNSIFMNPAEFKQALLDKIRAFSRKETAKNVAVAPAAQAAGNVVTAAPAPQIRLRPFPPQFQAADIIAIGSSTGGVQALLTMAEGLRGKLTVPMVITQHMPPAFTTMLAVHIGERSGLPTHEAREGMRVEKGNIYIAQGGLHMQIMKDEHGSYIHLLDSPPENFCRPAVDPMLRSVYEIYKKNILCVILTGMGSDGLLGAQRLVEAGNVLIAQDEATSAVWGMPGAAARAGLCHAVLPLDEISGQILRFMPR